MTLPQPLGSVPKYEIRNLLVETFHLIYYYISLEMPVPSQGHYGFHSFPVVD